VRTDGVNLTWTPLGLAPAADDAPPPVLPCPEEPRVPPDLVEEWRQAGEDASLGLRELRGKLDDIGDVARLQAVQSAALHIAAQPALLGLDAAADAVAPVLKCFYM